MSPQKQPSTDHLKDFDRLTPSIFLHQPAPLSPASQPTSPSASPSLIVLTTWMSASPRHISKYATHYQTLFPSVPILIITTSPPDMIYRPYSSQQKRLAPAISVLLQHTADAAQSQAGNPILLHAFSNAGGHAACQLAHAYRAQTGRALPIGAMVLDSSPGAGTFARTIASLSPLLPSAAVPKAIGTVAIYVVTGVLWAVSRATDDNLVEKLRADLNDPGLFGAGGMGRLYVYSRADEVVGAEDVEAHAAEAAKGGWKVAKESYVGSGHVGHMVQDGERYWGAIRGLWEVASL